MITIKVTSVAGVDVYVELELTVKNYLSSMQTLFHCTLDKIPFLFPSHRYPHGNRLLFKSDLSRKLPSNERTHEDSRKDNSKSS